MEQVVLESDEKSWCTLKAEANNKVLGKRLGKAVAGVKKALVKLDTASLWPLLEVSFCRRLPYLLLWRPCLTLNVKLNKPYGSLYSTHDVLRSVHF